MRPIEPPDSHHVAAMHGWIELGNSREARVELARLTEAARKHPDALNAHWHVCAAERAWEEALTVATTLVGVAPDDPTGWVDQSYALHELKRTDEAMALLRPMAERFPKTGVIPYNLACYACRLGDLDEARRWLARASTLRERDGLLRLALADRDLEPLWDEIRRW